MKILQLMFLMLACVVTTSAQTQWEFKLDQEVYNPILSPDGSRLVYFTEDDSSVAHCVDVATGKHAWSRTLNDFDNFQVGRFVGNDTVLLGQQTRFEFVNAKNGSVFDTVAIAGDSWDELVWNNTADAEHDTIRPYFMGSVGIFYFDDGMQILDLSGAKLIYQTEESPSALKYKQWETVLMINPTSGADTLYFVDVEKKKVVYKADKDGDDLNSSVYQPFAISNGELMLFNEDNIQSVDLATSKLNATIDIDPDDPEFYSPVIFKEALYLMVSDEGVQSLYKTKTGELLWKTKEGDIAGVAEQLVELPNDEGLLYAYDDDGRMMIYKVGMKTGNIIWNRHMFTQDGEFETGHKQGNQLLATLGKIALSMLTAYGSGGSGGRWGHNPYTGMMEYRPGFGSSMHDRRVRQENIRRANEMYNSWINTEKKSDGYTALLEMKDDQAIFVAGGLVYSPASKGDADSYNGEGLITLNLKDGSVVSNQAVPLIALSDKDKFNAVQDINIRKLDSTDARALIGVNDVYIARLDKIERFSFGEEAITFINSSVREVTFRANHDDEYYDYWRIDASVTPAKKILLARTWVPNLLFIDSTVEVKTTLKLEEEQWQGYPLITGDVSDASFVNPKWTLNEDQIDEFQVGDLGEDVKFDNRIQGVMQHGADVYMLGSDAIGFISGDGKCKWAHEWAPDSTELKSGFTMLDRAFIYATGGSSAVVMAGCPSKELNKSHIDFSDTEILHNKKDRAVIVDTDEGIIRGFAL
ncbi:MAG TPA: hypothetical protein VNA88_11135 [Candidatus Kapabacteria bacterium]|nr:hypothetical protein [Candidatus Kapabacteria bacterium]